MYSKKKSSKNDTNDTTHYREILGASYKTFFCIHGHPESPNVVTIRCFDRDDLNFEINFYTHNVQSIKIDKSLGMKCL
jgi:hypothetical protein